MNFGDKLKRLRADKGWTQPDAAETIGVEQSYLSKLENGHSTPSGAVFERILEAYGLSVADMLEGLDHSAKAQLRQIAEVDQHLSSQTDAQARQRRRLAGALTVCMALGAALIYAGQVHLFFADTEHRYTSLGVVKAGEPSDLFQRPPAHVRSPEAIDAYREDIAGRRDELELWSAENRGTEYTAAVPGGSRLYIRDGSRPINRSWNQFVTFLGVFAVTLGFFGLLVQASSKRRPG